MIFRPSTVLILGAGATQPYGFPLGSELMQMIKDSTSADHRNKFSSANRPQLAEAGYAEDEIAEFHTALKKAGHANIDAFLEDRPSHRKLGTFVIAQILMPVENEDNLFRGDWYPRLFRALDLKAAD